MRAVIASKAFVVAAYRQKLVEMARLGVEVHAIVPPAWREGRAVLALEHGHDRSYELIVTPIRWNGHFHIHYYPELPAVLHRLRPDIVHLDEEPYNLATYLGIRAAARRRLPALFFTWQNLLRRYPLPFRQLERSVYRHAAHALAGSDDAAAVLQRKGFDRRITVIPQFGVDPAVFCPGASPTGPFTIGFLNRLVPGKAPLLALEALQTLAADTRLVMVGDGPLRMRVAEEITRLGLSSRVELRGRVPSSQMPDIIRSLDAVILPSLTLPGWKEQFGRVLIEAMACGVPVVGSSSGEIPHVIGDAGLVVPEGDAEALGAALRNLYDQPDLHAALGERGRQRVLQLYTHQRIAERTVQVYREVADA